MKPKIEMETRNMKAAPPDNHTGVVSLPCSHSWIHNRSLIRRRQYASFMRVTQLHRTLGRTGEWEGKNVELLSNRNKDMLWVRPKQNMPHCQTGTNTFISDKIWKWARVGITSSKRVSGKFGSKITYFSQGRQAHIHEKWAFSSVSYDRWIVFVLMLPNSLKNTLSFTLLCIIRCYKYLDSFIKLKTLLFMPSDP